MYEKYVGFRYLLKINGMSIGESDPRRRFIQRISTEIRRQGLSSLSITFSDPDLQWRNYFTVPNPIKVEFIGYNFDGSAPDYFEGYVSQVSPMTAKNMYDIEVMCLGAPPSITNSQQKARTFKNMTRKQVISQLAKENKVHVHFYTTSELNTKEEEFTLSINTSIVDFMMQILEEIGYRFTTMNLKEWVVTPMFSHNTKNLGGTYTNKGQDTSLLDFQPTFSRYSYEEDEKKSESGNSTDNKAKKAIDPKTKTTNGASSKQKPTNKPTSGKTKGSKSSNTSGGRDMYYDPKTGKWLPVK